jgi:hypothetical protein
MILPLVPNGTVHTDNDMDNGYVHEMLIQYNGNSACCVTYHSVINICHKYTMCRRKQK